MNIYQDAAAGDISGVGGDILKFALSKVPNPWIRAGVIAWEIGKLGGQAVAAFVYQSDLRRRLEETLRNQRIEAMQSCIVIVRPDGGSGSTYQDELVDFELPDGSFNEVTVGGSFTVSYEWVIKINPQLNYPDPFIYFGFLVDGKERESGHFYADENGYIRLNRSVTVTGEGVHTLKWWFNVNTSLPVSCRVVNVKVVRSAKKYAATAKSAATVVPHDPTPMTEDQSVTEVSKKSGATCSQKPPSQKMDAQSTKASSLRLLASPGNDTTLPRLYCYERYVAVKGVAYRFALSADEDASISVSGLPSGFSFSDGVISGIASAAGTTTMTIAANGSSGTTTKSVQFTVIEATEDFQPIVSLMSHPDLRPSMASGWSAPLVISTSADSTHGATAFLDTDSLYVSWLIDCGNVNAEGTFYTYLYVDDVLEHTWYTEGLPKDYYVWNIGHSLGSLSAGTHKVRVVTDATDVISESNEFNNSFETTITVARNRFPDLSVSSLSVSRTSIAVSEPVTVHWWVENIGNEAAGKSKIAFLTYKYEASSGEAKLVKTEWIDCLPLAAGGRHEFTKTINGKSLGDGVFSFAVAVDGEGSILERNETDNVEAVAVSVSKDSATSSKSNVDWQFNKMKGEADSFFLSTSSDLKKKATAFNVGQPIYMRCCWWNAKKSAVPGAMRVRVFLNGGTGIYSDRSSFDNNTWYFLTNLTPGFLQNLPAGSYTLTAILDSENAWLETNEKNNVKSISFTVVGHPTIASETTYYCAINEPVSWPVTIDGKVTVKGLPSGLKYSGGAITGKATKVGTYTATFSANNAAGSASRAITIVVEDPGFAVTCSAKPNGTSPHEVASGDTLDLFVGVKQEFSLSANPRKAGVENSAVSSMSAKGLPSGLKLSGGVISGVPTKPGSYSATITFKNKYGWTSSFDMQFVVSALPVWASGTFEGGCGTMWEDGARITFTVSSVGKLSGKIFRLGETWTMTASAYSACIDGYFVFDAVLKNGKNTMDERLGVWQFAGDDIGAFYMAVDSWNAEMYATRTAWTTGICAEALTRANVIGKSLTLDGDSLEGLASGESIKLTFAKNGSVKASANLVSGEKNGKVTFKSKSASVSLVPWWIGTTESGAPVVNGAKLFLQFPPSGKNSADGRFFDIGVGFANGDVTLLQY